MNNVIQKVLLVASIGLWIASCSIHDWFRVEGLSEDDLDPFSARGGMWRRCDRFDHKILCSVYTGRVRTDGSLAVFRYLYASRAFIILGAIFAFAAMWCTKQWARVLSIMAPLFSVICVLLMKYGVQDTAMDIHNYAPVSSSSSYGICLYMTIVATVLSAVASLMLFLPSSNSIQPIVKYSTFEWLWPPMDFPVFKLRTQTIVALSVISSILFILASSLNGWRHVDSQAPRGDYAYSNAYGIWASCIHPIPYHRVECYDMQGYDFTFINVMQAFSVISIVCSMICIGEFYLKRHVHHGTTTILTGLATLSSSMVWIAYFWSVQHNLTFASSDYETIIAQRDGVCVGISIAGTVLSMITCAVSLFRDAFPSDTSQKDHLLSSKV